MSEEQMRADLERLARRDGCIAAAWVLEEIERLGRCNEQMAETHAQSLNAHAYEYRKLEAENQKLRSRLHDTESVLHETAADRRVLLHERDDARAENKRLQHDIEVLMDCRRYNQRCHECPDTECCDNTREVSDE